MNSVVIDRDGRYPDVTVATTAARRAGRGPGGPGARRDGADRNGKWSRYGILSCHRPLSMSVAYSDPRRAGHPG